MARKEIHIVPSGGDWAVRRPERSVQKGRTTWDVATVRRSSRTDATARSARATAMETIRSHRGIGSKPVLREPQ